MTEKYTVKPLVWEGDKKDKRAQTPFGSYYVRYDGGWKWGYCFDEYYDEDSFSCVDLEDGKSKVQDNWMERISGALVVA